MEKKTCFGQTRTTGFIWSLLAVLLLWHSPASAAYYSWSYNGTGDPRFSSAASACLAYVDIRPPEQQAEYIGVRRGSSDTQWVCDFKYLVRSDYWQQTTKALYRTGDSCESGEYDPNSGSCTTPPEDPCLPTTGNKITHRHKLGEILLGTIATTPPPASLCHKSCRYSDPELDGKPYRFVNGEPGGAWANFSYFGDGVQCDAGEQEADPPSENKPVADKENKCTNKVCLTADADGNCQQYTYSCTATEKYTDPGAMDCDFGTFNGEAVCVPNSPAPKMTEKEVKTEVTEKTNSDGSKETTTTTTTTTTNCTGVGSCSTTTTTNVSNGKTNADGTPGGETSTCTGPDCKAGDGKSQNDQKEEEKSESKVSGDSSCEAPPVCTGDAIQCSILRQNHQQRCADQKWQEIDEQKLMDGVSGEMAGSEYQPFGEQERGAFDFTGMIDTSSTIGGSCPAIPPITFTIRGVTRSVDFGIAMAEICKYASWFSFLLVAFSMRRAAEIVAGGMA
ncbi:hypothetical protein [Stutzerimonas nitrititolerans]|uniref:hypothetical protein n=1 Tax=Stutzerimonas nitrititolerans TaxID=2482751 RepID=UPI00289A7473|nr:hypothetical protein [Stutzerimonas nitrititolerans]